MRSRKRCSHIWPAADEWIREEPTDLEDRFWNLVFKLSKQYGQFGVAVLSRERVADVAAAELTGLPAALAGDLERPTEARDRPETDPREWKRSVARPWTPAAAGTRRLDRAVLDPPAGRDAGRTPQVDDRICRDETVTADSPVTGKPYADISN